MTDTPVPPDEQKQHADQSGSSRTRVSTAKQAPAESISSMITAGRENTRPEMPMASGSPTMSTPKPGKNTKKKLAAMIEEVKWEIAKKKGT